MDARQIYRFMREAREVSYRSRDPKTKCGAILVSSSMEIISSGYNGYPIGWSDEYMASHELREKFGAGVVHAEVNALILADSVKLEGSAMFVTKEPCTRCAAIIAQYRAAYGGPVKIYCPPIEGDSQWNSDADYRNAELEKSDISIVRVL